ncbi:MAG: hypothetical protein MRJ92_01610 [Nitrospira sp.]|nr:hypothetical protein [Nitrospira sp.]
MRDLDRNRALFSAFRRNSEVRMFEDKNRVRLFEGGEQPCHAHPVTVRGRQDGSAGNNTPSSPPGCGMLRATPADRRRCHTDDERHAGVSARHVRSVAALFMI